jgi:hypothetical protein
MTTTRTDVHRPTALVTEDYEYSHCYDSHPSEGDLGYHVHFMQMLLAEGWTFGRVHDGNTCDHCGARLRYVAVLKHLPSGTLIKVGETCLENRFSLATAQFQALRKNAQLNRERTKKIDTWNAWLDLTEGAQTAYDYLTSDDVRQKAGGNDFLYSLLCRVSNNLPLSEKQLAAVLRSKDRDEEFAARRAEEAKNAKPIISGKQTIIGKILSLKINESAYGDRLVMTVLDDRGFRVWGTVPKPIEIVIDRYVREGHHSGPHAHVPLYKDLLASREIRVKFDATVKASDRDETFGFFTRPKNGEVI